MCEKKEHMDQQAPVLKFCYLRPEKDSDIPLPRYMSEGAAGMDIAAAVDSPVTLAPGDIYLAPTGLAVAIPTGFELQVRPRSGLAVKHGVTLANAPGTIDRDYRGEIKVVLINLGPKPYTIYRGDRVAQLVLSRAWRARVERATALDDTSRSKGGFGHTGK